ncbi:MAG: SEC-C domain-containing protein [Lachnospiraceae bacterium]|nr:SEC-C domain-containing protein [Lachnospiraceae bacterium]
MMSREIITVKTADEELRKAEISKVIASYPASMARDVRAVYSAAEKKEYQESAEICCRLLDQKEVPEIQMLLGTDYFLQGQFGPAEEVFSDLVTDYPEVMEYHIYHGRANHALGRYEDAVKELGAFYPLEEYLPFYYTSYGDSLQQIGKLRQSREAFYADVEYFDKTGEIVSQEMLDGAFQNLLYLDVTLGNRKYPEDLQTYYRFLERAEMTDVMQEYLAETIVCLCGLMRSKWYRPLFLEFITHIKNADLLTNAGPKKTLESAFASWESFAYHEDNRICSLVETYLSSNYQKAYLREDLLREDDKKMVDAEVLSYEWYMCRYVPEHWDILDYIRDTYPYSWALTSDFLEEIRTDAQKTTDRKLEELYSFSKALPRNRDMTRGQFMESVQRAYKAVIADKKEPAYVYDGDGTYKKIQAKVGRNDPCPCGSGKKYKKCCGR